MLPSLLLSSLLLSSLIIIATMKAPLHLPTAYFEGSCGTICYDPRTRNSLSHCGHSFISIDFGLIWICNSTVSYFGTKRLSIAASLVSNCSQFKKTKEFEPRSQTANVELKSAHFRNSLIKRVGFQARSDVREESQ